VKLAPQIDSSDRVESKLTLNLLHPCRKEHLVLRYSNK